MIEEISIGTDIEEIKRFENKTLEKDIDFLNRIFTKNELEYCYKNRNYAQHLCARFCAKEAVIKALTDLGITSVSYSEIEVKKHESGVPYVELKGFGDLKIKISLSHCKSYATATALIKREH